MSNLQQLSGFRCIFLERILIELFKIFQFFSVGYIWHQMQLTRCFKQTMVVTWLIMKGLNRCLGGHIVSLSWQCFML
jgi:hypothetical protein